MGRLAWLLKQKFKILTFHARFAEKVIRASKGETGLVEPSYVYLPGVPGGDAIAKVVGTDFFSVPIELGVRSLVLDYSIERANLRYTAQWCREGRQRSGGHHPEGEGAPGRGHQGSQGQHREGRCFCPQPSPKVNPAPSNPPFRT
jgi:hypothetical protein